jgi:hypothetical protein
MHDEELCEIYGHVSDSIRDWAISNATVAITSTNISTKTDHHGRYKLVNIPPGYYVICASKSGYRTERIRTDLKSGDTKRIDLRLVPLNVGKLTGIVTDERGNPIPDATITVYSSDNIVKTVTTDIDGNFVVYLLPGFYDVVVSKSGWKRDVFRHVIVFAGESTEVSFTLRPQPRISPLLFVVIGAILCTTVLLLLRTALRSSRYEKYKLRTKFHEPIKNPDDVLIEHRVTEPKIEGEVVDFESKAK